MPTKQELEEQLAAARAELKERDEQLESVQAVADEAMERADALETKLGEAAQMPAAEPADLPTITPAEPAQQAGTENARIRVLEATLKKNGIPLPRGQEPSGPSVPMLVRPIAVGYYGNRLRYPADVDTGTPGRPFRIMSHEFSPNWMVEVAAEAVTAEERSEMASEEAKNEAARLQAEAAIEAGVAPGVKVVPKDQVA